MKPELKRKERGYFSVSELAREYQVSPDTFWNMIKGGHLPRPTKKFLMFPRCYYDAGDVKAIKKVLDKCQ